MKISVSSYIAKTLVEHNIRHVFLVTGGGAMFLNDALSNEQGLTPVFNHHEQACAIAAEGYARITGTTGLINVTTGPGSINALNGVFGAWTDSVPMLILSGQVKRETCLSTYNLPQLRQLGDQEVDIIPIVKSITKYAEQVKNPDDITYCLDKALYLAAHGRPGPCWLDIPVDVQASLIDPTQLAGYFPEEELPPNSNSVSEYASFIIAKLAQAQRPVIMAGTGVRIGHALEEFEQVIRLLGIPVVTAWTHDLIASDDSLFCGRPGTIGTRAGNFTVQNADVLLILGSRLNIRQISYNWQAFAKKAFKIQVDIDEAELHKPTCQPDYAVCCDVKPLLEEMLRQLQAEQYKTLAHHQTWLTWCRERVLRYPIVTPTQRQYQHKINPYHFIEVLFEQLEEDDIVVCGNATACIVPFQVANIKRGQRLFSNSGSASMGYDLPAAIGAYFGALAAHGVQRRIICLAGDGSLQMNIQELQTVAHYQIPIKIFVLNNNGYLSIRSSQKNFFGRLSGADPESGVTFPDYAKVAAGYGIKSSVLNQADFQTPLAHLLQQKEPYLCDVLLDETQGFEPRMSSRQLEDGRIVTPPLEDMYPFLDRIELNDNLIIKN